MVAQEDVDNPELLATNTDADGEGPIRLNAFGSSCPRAHASAGASFACDLSRRQRKKCFLNRQGC